MDANEQPEPVRDIVLHPGDTIATGAFAGDRYVNYIRLLDRHGVCYAVLDGERDVAGHGWFIHAIRSVSALQRRELLPVRPQPEPDDEPDPVADLLAVGKRVAERLGSPHLTPAEPHPRHTHNHPHADPTDAFAVAYWHDHPHAHAGALHGPEYDRSAADHAHAHSGDTPAA